MLFRTGNVAKRVLHIDAARGALRQNALLVTSLSKACFVETQCLLRRNTMLVLPEIQCGFCQKPTACFKKSQGLFWGKQALTYKLKHQLASRTYPAEPF